MVELKEPLETLIAPSANFNKGTGFPRANEIRLYDTTLRDGEQTPGVAFTPEQKFELACLLSDAGLHIIDMGFPSAAPSERRALELILEGRKTGRLRKDLEIIVMCRSNARDIDITIDTLERTQGTADTYARQAATGRLERVEDYMVAATEAQLTTQLTVAVRNKAVEAFQEIMRMTV